ncbi:poly(A)-specific ribonuclease [Dipsacomyces acuminosporus]|nr:poly(A)-specific ribonuclease [Dipsacomyces acuminosporus]
MSGVPWSEYTQHFNALEGTEAAWPLFSVEVDNQTELLYTGDASGRVTTYTLAVDNQTELLYTGDASGRVTTYTLAGTEEALERQTSFLCSHTPIRKFHKTGAGIVVQSDDSIQLRTPGGRKVFGRTTTPNDLFTASAFNSVSQSELLVCTSAGAGTILSLDRGTVQKRVLLELSTVVMDYGASLTLGTMDGTLAVRDPRSAFKVIQAVTAFDGPVVDMAKASDNLVFACGMSADAQDYQQEEESGSAVKIFDVRNFKSPVDTIECEEPLTKLWVSGDSRLWMCYESGFAEARNPNSCHEATDDYIEPALSEYAYSSAFCISPSGNAALVADTEGFLHVWTNTEDPVLSIGGGTPDVIVTQQQATSPIGSNVRIDDEAVSLSCVPMPNPTEPLLSRMSPDYLYDVGRPAGHVDPNIAVGLKQMGGVGYAPNPRTHKRNQQPFGTDWRRKWREGGPAATDDDELTQGKSKFLSMQRWQGQHRRVTSGISSSPQIGTAPPASAAAGTSMVVANSGVLNGGRTASYDTASRGSPIPSTSVAGNAPLATAAASYTSGKVPSNMQQMRIEYSRFGVEDFDFSLYNSTRWSGLESNISNSYANALLQVMFFNEELRAIAFSHCSSDCRETYCLTCQLGFLFRMLETSNGQSCHATHLLQVLTDRAEATALALLEDAHGNPANGTSYSVLVQRLMRFMLEQARNECAPLMASLSKELDSQQVLDAIIGFPQETRTVCPACSNTQARSSHVFSVDLESPHGSADLATLLAGGSASVRRAESMRRLKKFGMIELIEQALSKSETTRAWCPCCKKFQLLRTEKSMAHVPTGYLAFNFPLLDPAPANTATTAAASINPVTGAAMGSCNPQASNPAAPCSTAGSAAKEQTAQWQLSLPKTFGLKVTHDQADAASSANATKPNPKRRVQVIPLDSPADKDQGDESAEGDEQMAEELDNFELVAVISSIRDTPRSSEHLITHIKDPENHDGWLLFNDFLVQYVPEDRVTCLFDWWRTPSIAIYANTDRRSLAKAIDVIKKHHPYKISTKILTYPSSVLDRPASYRRSGNSRGSYPHSKATNKRNSAVPLTRAEAELLSKGEFTCAFDAEFVVLEAAKTEVFSDGTQEMIRPPIHTLARLSVIRANDGPMYGVPFIDDYVQITRPIADLATQYSGIHAGDLNPATSPYKLSTMKEAYRKLRLLVDSGCTIIGHGLRHDFRVCNIIVPLEQQRDTMTLFQSQSHIRPISLKFLYWYFHRKTIQTGEHSSVEDAHAALKVYESYIQCKTEDPENGIEDVLDMIYLQGSRLAWKIPES